MDADEAGGDHDAMQYRLEVAGVIPPDWAGWFDADSVTPAVDATILTIRVADQSELYGRLRRIHDLNLRLISMTRVRPET